MTLDDQASEREEKDREISLQQRKPSGPPPVGYCYNCNEPVAPGERWCDADCRDDWSFRQ